MRAMLTAAVGVTLCFALFGCDQNPQQAQMASTPVAVAPPPTCNCPQAAAPAVRTARHRVARHRYAYREHHGHHRHTLSEFLAYSTDSSTYSESESSSVREYRPGDEMRYSQTSYSESHGGGAQYQQGASAEAWVDGYGRAHYADYGPPDDENPGMISRKDERERMRPYRGYNSKCDSRID